MNNRTLPTKLNKRLAKAAQKQENKTILRGLYNPEDKATKSVFLSHKQGRIL
jgi:hypothetical protein